VADPVRVFISYSRRDSELVTPVVSLLRSLPFPVFRDVDGILPGQRWEDRLIDELSAASHVLVFWCDHAAASEWVDLEADLAAEDASKVVVPVLLDDTPLPPELADRQAVDLRILAPIHPEDAPHPNPGPPPDVQPTPAVEPMAVDPLTDAQTHATPPPPNPASPLGRLVGGLRGMFRDLFLSEPDRSEPDWMAAGKRITSPDRAKEDAGDEAPGDVDVGDVDVADAEPGAVPQPAPPPLTSTGAGGLSLSVFQEAAARISAAFEDTVPKKSG